MYICLNYIIYIGYNKTIKRRHICEMNLMHIRIRKQSSFDSFKDRHLISDIYFRAHFTILLAIGNLISITNLIH